MLTNILPDPFLWFSHHQWGVLLGGLVGAVISALVAVLVLKWTLRTQRAQFEKSLDRAEQHHAEQLSAPQREAALAREIDARANLVSMTSDFSSVLQSQTLEGRARLQEVDRLIAVTVQKWRINLTAPEDAPLRNELSAWGGLLGDTAGRPLGYPVATDGERQAALDRCLEALQKSAINYRLNSGATEWTADFTAGQLNAARVQAQAFADALP